MDEMKKVLEGIADTKELIDEILRRWAISKEEKEKGAEEFIENLAAWISFRVREKFADSIEDFGGLMYMHFMAAFLKAAREMVQRLGEDLYPPFGGSEEPHRN